jgi:hypothetical protein
MLIRAIIKLAQALARQAAREDYAREVQEMSQRREQTRKEQAT